MAPASSRLPPSRARRAGARDRRPDAALRVFVSDGRGRSVRDGGLGAWLAAAAPRRARGEVAVALVSDAEVRKLNLRYRRTDAPTDVLSFSAGRAARLPVRDWGDIVIAKGVARRQARDAGHSYATELRVLALHGLLHLLGYDHHRTADGLRMARAEARLLRKGGLAAGLIARSGRVRP